MSPLLRLAANDVRLTLRDRASAFWLLALPVFLIWIFGRMTGGAAPPRVALTVVDRDGGWIAQAFAEEFRSPNVELAILDSAAATPEAVRKALRRIVLPAGFTEGVLAGRQQRIRIEVEEGASADNTRAADIVATRAIVRTLARVAEMRETHAALDVATFDALKARPPLVHLASTSAGHGTAVRGMEQSVPGNLTFTVMMMTLIYGAVFLTIEKREGMLRRQLTLPLSRTTIFAGKVLGRLFIAVLQIAVLIVVGRFLFQIDYGRSALGLWTLLISYAFAVAGIATFLGAILANPEQASTVGWLSSTVMGALGGCWWPAEVMPDWLRHAAHVFPTAWAMDGLHALISFGRGFEAVVVPSAVLMAFGAAFSWLAARKLRAVAG
jgi:ABC-type multidrug transport system permease subunit